MKRIITLFSFIMFIGLCSCSLVSHEEKGRILVQFDSAAMLANLENKTAESRGLSESRWNKHNFTAELSVSSGSNVFFSQSSILIHIETVRKWSGLRMLLSREISFIIN